MREWASEDLWLVAQELSRMLNGDLSARAVAALQKLVDLGVDVDLSQVEEALPNGAT